LRSIAILTLSITSAGPIAANRLVGFDRAQIAAAGKVAMGAAEYPAASAGRQLAVNVLGTARVEAGAALAEGQVFMAGADGRAVPVANGGAVAGRALQPVGAAGVVFEALLLPSDAATA
jgi:hypothetical protein